MKVRIYVSYRQKDKPYVSRELIANPSYGSWPEHLWPQLAYKVFMAYGDEKLGDFCHSVAIDNCHDLGDKDRIARTFSNSQLKKVYSDF